jgi:hypothetical protein
MKTNRLICLDNITSDLLHPKFYVINNSITITIFVRQIPYIENFENDRIVSDEEALNILSDDCSSVNYDHLFKASQLNLPTNTGIWGLSDRIVYQLSNINYSNSETTPPCYWGIFLQHTGKLIGPNNIYIDNYISKSNLGRTTEKNKGNPVLTLFSMSNNPNITNSRITLSYNPKYFFDCNISADDLSYLSIPERQQELYKYMPKIVSPQSVDVNANSTTNITATFIDPETDLPLNNYSSTIYIETTGGYVNKNRIVSNPSGTISVRPLDLNSGDEFKVKFGWRHYTGASETLVKVV